MNDHQKHQALNAQRGFSLIEVLVALVIISVSLGAFIKTTQTNVTNTISLKQTLSAQNIAWNKLTGDNEPKNSPYQITTKDIKTEVKKIQKRQVTVNYKQKELITLTQFVYVE